MSHIVRFGSYEADLDSGQLRKRGVRIKLRDQPFQVLISLLEHPGEVVTREALRQRLWGNDVIVDFENNLNTAVGQLRQALCDSFDHPHFIETLPKRGYRFIADVSRLPAPAESQTRRARLVVLPFLNSSADPAQEYFSDAITDEMITALASLAPEQLAVIARTTAMHYKGGRKDVAHIARELGVDYAVEGAVRRGGRQVSINVQLIQTSDQTHLFAKRWDAELDELFNLEETTARAIASHIPGISGAVPERGAVPGRFRKPTADLAAYNDYIQGRYHMWKWTPEDIAKAKQLFEAALARDPEFALAYDGLAELCWYLGFWGFAPPSQMDLIGRGYALRAVEIDDSLAGAHALLGYFPKGAGWDWAASQQHMARARELNPNSPVVKLRCGIAEMVLGRYEKAIADLESALESDPLSIELRGWLAEVLYIGRQYELALAEAQQLLELAPSHYLAYMVLGHASLGVQDFEGSIVALRKAVELSAGAPLILGSLGLALGLGGHTDEARAVLERLRGIASQRYVPPTSFAWTHLGLGEIDDAFVWMDRAADMHDRMLSPIKGYPFLDPLRGDQRFLALLRKTNLEH